MNILTGILISIVVLTQFSCTAKPVGNKLADGTYVGRSQAKYTDEPYVGTAKIEIVNSKIIKVEFQIVDTLKNEVFGSDYDKHFPDNVIYKEQCHNDWKGVQTYPVKLLEKQNIESVDAVSGATWSYNIFTASVKKALNK
jgi:major membrane immunogen (membrane-anchored lipoprotein)